MVLRFSADGILDTDFGPVGSGGVVTPAYGPENNVASGVALQNDGRIVVAGSASNADGTVVRFGLARLDAQGMLDTTFNSTGSVPGTLVDPFADGNRVGKDLARTDDGKIVVVGRDTTSSKSVIAVARYLQNGQPDVTFGQDGWKLIDFGESIDDANDIENQDDGRVVVLGRLKVEAEARAVLARLDIDGSLDQTFGDGGRIVTALALPESRFRGVDGLVTEESGSLVIAGKTIGSAPAVLRLLAGRRDDLEALSLLRSLKHIDLQVACGEGDQYLRQKSLWKRQGRNGGHVVCPR